jgi:formylglycine-generating enzyme required for sulfatase activity
MNVFILAVSLAALSATAQVPGLISHQGKVTVAGTNYTGAGLFKFALVNAAGDATYWSNDGTSNGGAEPTSAVTLPVARGIFSVNLGDTTVTNMTQTIPASAFTNSAVYLRVWFNDGVNGSQLLTPDRRITSVAYALKATTAASADAVAAGAITGTLGLGQLPGAVVTNTATGVTLGGTFTGNGAGLTNLPAAAAAPPGMVLIPAGPFTMGDPLDSLSDAVPISTTVSAFYMDVNLVSWSQWQSVYYWATNHGYGFVHAGAGKAANHPVQTVDWYDCVKWCNARSQQAGRPPVYYTDAGFTQVYTNGEVATLYPNWTASGYRLPTEAEWEKAARGGLSGQRFPWGNVINQNLANYDGNTSYAYDLGPDGYNAIGNYPTTSPGTSPVGSFAPNGYGLNDMAGNTWEWCWDWYGTTYAGGSDPHGPAGPLSNRVLRGGTWSWEAYYCRAANRNYDFPTNGYITMGFRSVLPPGQ